MIDKFWLYTPLNKMTNTQWESLCDGCGKCCLEKIEDQDTKKIYTTRVSCRLLDTKTCQCNRYEKRFHYVDDCIKLNPKNVYTISWLPKNCAYRLVKEKKDLFSWHPLLSGDKNSTIKSGNSAKEFAVHPVLMDRPIIEYILEDDE